MKKHFLTSMTKFIKDYYSDELRDELQTLDLFDNYATFLLQPLTLGMFVPCDKEGNILKEPEFYEMYKKSGFPFTNDNFTQKQSDKAKEFFRAKEKVFFKTKFEIDDQFKDYLNEKFETIEELANVHQFELTESAITKIGFYERV